MARSTTTAKVVTRPAIEKKALAESNKSEGMRMLFDNSYTVVGVMKVFGAPYGFVYGVAKRHGVVEKAANRRPIKAVETKTVKATKVARTAARERKAAPQAQAPRARKTQPAAKKTGRPTAARRQANRATA